MPLQFGHVVFSQVRVLLNGLNKKNVKQTSVELTELVDGYGQDVYVFLLRSLLMQIDFRDAKSARDPPKQQLLAQELARIHDKPNFVSVLCQTFEGGPPLTDDFLPNLVKTLKLSPLQQSILAVALSHSPDESVKGRGLGLLKARLSDLSLQGLQSVGENVGLALLYLVNSNAAMSDDRGNTAKLVRAAFPGIDMSASKTPFVSGVDGKDHGGSVQALVASIASGSVLCEALSDIGYAATSSKDALMDVLSRFHSLSEPDVARMLGLMSATQSGLNEGVTAAFFGSGGGGGDKMSWDLDVFVAVLNQRCPNLNWRHVIRSLDFPAFAIADSRGLALIATAYRKATNGKPFPVDALLERWANTRGQLSVLRYCVVAPPELGLDLSKTSRVLPPTEEIPVPPFTPWVSLDLMEALAGLTEAEGVAAVRSIFEGPAVQCPELLLMVLMHISANFGPFHLELISVLLTNVIASCPNSAPSLRLLWSKRRPFILNGLIEMWRRDPHCMPRILEVVYSTLKELPAVLETKPPAFALDMAVLAASRDILNLEQWITGQLQAHGDLFAAACMQYLRDRHSGNSPVTIPVEAGSLIARVLGSSGKVSAATQEELKALHAQLAQMQPKPGGPPQGGAAQAQGGQGALAPGQGGGVQEQGTPANNVFAPDIEEEANSHFQKIYAAEMDIEAVIHMLKGFKTSRRQREQEVFACMIHNLFDEYRFFPRYPEKELMITGKLFGSLIQHQLVSSITLGIALRYVLEALRKALRSNMFKFGMCALEQFKTRLAEWPPYCHHIIQMPHIRQAHPELVDFIQRALAGGAAVVGADGSGADKTLAAAAAQLLNKGGLQGVELTAGVANAGRAQHPLANEIPPDILRMNSEPSPAMLRQRAEMDPSSIPERFMGTLMHDMQTASRAADFLPSSQFPPLGGPGGAGGPMGSEKGTKATAANAKGATETPTAFGTSTNIDTLLSAADHVITPEESVQDRIHFIFNNLSVSNLDGKERELRDVMQDEWMPFLAQYIVVKRASIEPNYHGLYMQFIERLKQPGLIALILRCSLENVRVLLRSDKITSSSSERSLLKNLGSWLGLLTLARNKPLLHKDLNVKQLLLDAYDKGRLIAVIPFVAKILESCRHSKVFRPQNPWLMALMALLAELHPLPDLKLNIKFEIEVLCKNLESELKNLKPSQLLRNRTVIRENNPDWTVHDLSASQHFAAPSGGMPSLSGMGSLGGGLGAVHAKVPEEADVTAAMGAQQQLMGGAGGLGHSQTGAAAGSYGGGSASAALGSNENLSTYVTINPTISIFSTQPVLKQYALLAINQAIRDIITPVVERSVTIACITTRELLLKDFALETDEAKVRRAAHLMVQHLAGSLALVTCKEPLRVSMCNHLRQYLQRQNAGDQQQIEQAVQVTAADNLEFGCALIEKAAIDRAMRDIDTALDNATNLRRKQPGGGFDGPIFGARPQPQFMAQLPEPLRPKAGGLVMAQLRVYEDFSRLPRQAPAGSATADAPAGAVAAFTGADAAKAPTPAAPAPASASGEQGGQQGQYTLTQTLDRCNACLAKLEQAAQRSPTMALGMLAADHEVRQLVQQVSVCVMQSLARDDSAVGVAQKVFRRLFDAPSRLMRESLLAVLEGLRDVCKKLTKELTAWLIYADLERKLNRDIVPGLLRGQLLLMSEFDAHLAVLVDKGPQARSGGNETVIDFAAFLLHTCVLQNPWVAPQQLSTTLDALSKVAASKPSQNKNGQPDALTRVLDEINSRIIGSKSAPGSAQKQGPGGPLDKKGGQPVVKDELCADSDPPGLQEQVRFLFDQWLVTDVHSDKAAHAAYISDLQQASLLKGDEVSERFFRIVIELAVERCAAEGPAARNNFAPVEALSKLVLLLVKYFAEPLQNKIQLLSKVLSSYVRAINFAHRNQKTSFNQRPWHRLLHSLLVDLNGEISLETINHQILSAVANTLHTIRPAAIPGFAFSWLELVSHRLFMPRLLNMKNAKGWAVFHRLLIDLFKFLEPYLRKQEMTEPILMLYRGTLRVLLVLLHDFPELLCEFHFTFCDVIPPAGIQMRNLILSAFPRYIRPPDPFTPHLKVDLLPDIHKPPNIRSDVMAALAHNNLRVDLEAYLKGRAPSNFLEDLPQRLMFNTAAEAQLAGTRYNVPAINSLVLTIGTHSILQAQSKQGVPSLVQPSVSMDVFVKLARDMDSEGRYLFLNALANQLRYPNSHTHYFSCVLLFLFNEADKEITKEQITRVLIERLIVNKPHPWGLLITFIELIRNPRYGFWDHEFVRAAKEIEVLFQSVARNCLPPQQAQAVMATAQQAKEEAGLENAAAASGGGGGGGDI